MIAARQEDWRILLYVVTMNTVMRAIARTAASHILSHFSSFNPYGMYFEMLEGECF